MTDDDDSQEQKTERFQSALQAGLIALAWVMCFAAFLLRPEQISPATATEAASGITLLLLFLL